MIGRGDIYTVSRVEIWLYLLFQGLYGALRWCCAMWQIAHRFLVCNKAIMIYQPYLPFFLKLRILINLQNNNGLALIVQPENSYQVFVKFFSFFLLINNASANLCRLKLIMPSFKSHHLKTIFFIHSELSSQGKLLLQCAIKYFN